jgi:hypothetical protein
MSAILIGKGLANYALHLTELSIRVKRAVPKLTPYGSLKMEVSLEIVSEGMAPFKRLS